jgi:hypothetical protein
MLSGSRAWNNIVNKYEMDLKCALYEFFSEAPFWRPLETTLQYNFPHYSSHQVIFRKTPMTAYGSKVGLQMDYSHLVFLYKVDTQS